LICENESLIREELGVIGRRPVSALWIDLDDICLSKDRKDEWV